jgi:multiple sugar transport system substrate-binding protein
VARKFSDRPVIMNELDLLSRRLNRRDLVKTVTVAGGAIVFAGYGRSTHVTAQDKVKLSQWYHEYGEAGTQQAAERYAKDYTTVNPNVEVEMVWQPGDYAGQVLPAALLTDEGPDVYEGFPNVAMVKAGQVAPLDDIFTDEVKADFQPNDLNVNTIDGKIYAVKMIDDTGLLYYRKSILQDKGVNPPTTMDELIAAVKALDTGRVKGLFVGNDGGISALLNIAPWSAGSDFLVDNQIVFNNDRTALAYQKVKELNDTGGLLIGSPTDWWDPSAFTQGLAAMQWTGLWAMPGVKAGIGDDFEVLPWPALDAQGKPATFWGGWSEMVNAKSKHIDEAKAFVKWLWIENTANQQDWSLSYGFHVPPRLSAAASAEPLKTGPAAEAVQNLYADGHILPPQWTGAMGNYLTDAVSNIVKSGADPASTVADAATKCDAELKQVLGG